MGSALAAILLPVTASAAEPTATVVSPAARSQVSGTIEVEVQASGTPYVRLAVFARTAKQDWHRFDPQPVPEDGIVRFELPTWGYPYFELQPETCGSADPVSCVVSPQIFHDSTRLVFVDNPAPVVELPAAYTEIYPPADGPLPVRATGSGPDIKIRIANRSTVVAPGEDGAVDLLGALDVQNMVIADWCNPLWPEECLGNAYGAGPEVLIRHFLRAEARESYRADSPPAVLPVLSPNGDAVREDAEFYLRLDNVVDQTGTWSLLRSGETVVASTPLWDGAGRHGTAYVGVNPYRAAGATIPSGEYELVLDLEGFVGDNRLTNQIRLPLRIDTTPTRIIDITPSVRRFYPRVDGYRDRVRVTGRAIDGRADYVEACAINRDNRPVRCWYGLRIVDGRVRGLTWDGRNRAGKLAGAGYYRFRFETYDPYGNRATTTGGRVYLSRERR